MQARMRARTTYALTQLHRNVRYTFPRLSLYKIEQKFLPRQIH